MDRRRRFRGVSQFLPNIGLPSTRLTCFPGPRASIQHLPMNYSGTCRGRSCCYGFPAAMKDKLKPGSVFAGWLIAGGCGPLVDRISSVPISPRSPALGFSYSGLIAALDGDCRRGHAPGALREDSIEIAENWEEEYHVSGHEPVAKKPCRKSQDCRSRCSLNTERSRYRGRKAREKIAAREAKKAVLPAHTGER